MKFFIKLSILLIILFSISSCATIMQGRNSTRSLKVKSSIQGRNFKGAEVYVDGDFKGHTPLKVPVGRRNINHHIEVRQEGFQEAVYDMGRRPSVSYLMLDLVTTAGVGVFVDFISGAIYKPDRRKVVLPLYVKESKKEKKEEVIYVQTPPKTEKPTLYQDRERMEGILEAETYKPVAEGGKGFAVKADVNINLEGQEGQYYALLIGVEKYDDTAINSLSNPVRDTEELYEVLVSNYEFDAQNVQILKNPTRGNIVEAFDQLRGRMTANDNLLIFYAGHGYWDQASKLGYWLPSDAQKNSTANWLGNSSLKDYISAIPSKHTLLISDACFSGGIFQTRKAFSEERSDIKRLYDLPSRKAMTSGTLEEVPDESVFVHFLKKRLLENEEKYISSEALFSSFRRAVMNNSENVPQYGEIKGTGDEGGDFIFIKRMKGLMK